MDKYFWGLITGIVISVFGKLFVGPVHDLKKELGKLNSTLIFRYNIYNITPADYKENREDSKKIAQLLNLEVRVKINSACLPYQSVH